VSGDIVERLRHVAWLAEEGSEVSDLAANAADEIERLRGLLTDHGYHGPDCRLGKCWCDEAKEASREP
jgi:hypothetical protein